ncbi:MAG: pentapeptide repeat-containing protein [Acidobacteria bacterium]|nr:pentapeptide repeat-containing protein [Acidobacteriota bacterium]
MDKVHTNVSQTGSAESTPKAKATAGNGRAPADEAKNIPEVDCTEEAAGEKKRDRSIRAPILKAAKWLFNFIGTLLWTSAVALLILVALISITEASLTTQLILGVSAATSLLVFILWKVPKWQVSALQEVQPKDAFALENEARRTLAQILAGVLVLTGIYGTWRTSQVSEQGQITERFNKAIDQLGSETLTLKLGAIYSLERIFEDSVRDRGRIIELVTTYVRENAPFHKYVKQPPASPEPPTSVKGVKDKATEAEAAAQSRIPRADIQAVLNILRKRKPPADKSEEVSISLEKTDLYGANLQDAYLPKARFNQAELSRINFIGATLSGATFAGANLKDTDLFYAQLQNTDFFLANLEGANLDYADIEGADFRWAKGLSAEQLKKAKNVQKAKLPDELVKAFSQIGQ